MKKIISIFLALVCISFSGCFFSDYNGPSATETAKKVLECFDNDDVEGLKSLFCEDVLTNVDDLDEQIKEIFNLYEGKCVERGTINNPSEKSTRDGEIVYYDTNPFIHDIKTDENEGYYSLKMYIDLVNKKHPERVGVIAITLYAHDESYPKWEDMSELKTIGKLYL